MACLPLRVVGRRAAAADRRRPRACRHCTVATPRVAVPGCRGCRRHHCHPRHDTCAVLRAVAAGRGGAAAGRGATPAPVVVAGPARGGGGGSYGVTTPRAAAGDGVGWRHGWRAVRPRRAWRRPIHRRCVLPLRLRATAAHPRTGRASCHHWPRGVRSAGGGARGQPTGGERRVFRGW